jgi:chromosome segregation ATPase
MATHTQKVSELAKQVLFNQNQLKMPNDKPLEIAELLSQVAAMNQQLAAKDQQLAAMNQQLAAMNQQLAAKNQQLAAKEKKLDLMNQELAKQYAFTDELYKRHKMLCEEYKAVLQELEEKEVTPPNSPRDPPPAPLPASSQTTVD